MKGRSEREKMLKILRSALLDKANISCTISEISNRIYQPLEDDIIMSFAENIVANGGKFIYCKNEEDLINKLESLILYRGWVNRIFAYGDKLREFLKAGGINTNNILEDKPEVGITLCHSVSPLNSLIVLTNNNAEEDRLVKLPHILIIIVFTSQIAPDYKTTLKQLSENIPLYITTINPDEVLKEEIEELYLFTVENLN